MMEIDGATYLNAEKWGVPKVECQDRSSKHIVCSSLLGRQACLPHPSAEFYAHPSSCSGKGWAWAAWL